MPFHDGHIARESVQVKEKKGKGRAGPPHPVCLPSGGAVDMDVFQEMGEQACNHPKKDVWIR